MAEKGLHCTRQPRDTLQAAATANRFIEGCQQKGVWKGVGCSKGVAEPGLPV